MNFITRSIEEAGVNKHESIFDTLNTFMQVCRGSPLLIHNADLQRRPIKSEQVFDHAEQRVRELHFRGTVHFRFYDVDAAKATVRKALRLRAVCQRTSCCNNGVENPFKYFFAISTQDGIVCH